MEYFDITPSPRVLKMLGQIPLKGWQCIAELIDNSIDGIISNYNPEGTNSIDVHIPPTISDIKENKPVIITDTGSGMTKEQLNNSVKAGYSGKGAEDSLGLFGMGFNIASARLGTKATVWTSTKDIDHDIGIVIDLNRMQREKTFKIELQTRKDSIFSPLGESGTEIRIQDYSKEATTLIRNKKDIINRLKHAYSTNLFDKYDISLKINDEIISGKKFCIWNHEKEGRYATAKGSQVLPYIEIKEQKIGGSPFCEKCLIELPWVGEGKNRELPELCPDCHDNSSIIEREYKFSGWVGIQRYFSRENYGIDIIRNGRIIEHENKDDFFIWRPREKYNISEQRLELLDKYNGILKEYPIDNALLGGRIVGELNIDFIKPSFTKDSFDRTELYLDVLDIVRGGSPMQPNWATEKLQMKKNHSPLAELFYAFRYTDTGQKNLVCGKSGVNTPNAGNVVALNYRDKFFAGDPDFQDDDAWYDLVLIAEGRTDIDEEDDILDDNTITEEGNNNDAEDIHTEQYQGIKPVIWEENIDLEAIIGVPKKKVIVKKWTPMQIHFQPIVFINISTKEWHFLINSQHNIVKDFVEGWEDLILMEIANRLMPSIKDIEKWTISAVYFELKKKYFEERILNVNSIYTRANELIKDINEFLIRKEYKFDSNPSLNDEEINLLRANYIKIENKSIKKTKVLTHDSSFLQYMDQKYLFKFLEQYPYLIYDQHYFDLPFNSIDDAQTKFSIQKKYGGYFRDVQWIIENLVGLSDKKQIALKHEIITTKMSLEYLVSKSV